MEQYHLEALERAKEIWKSRTISPYFFAELAFAYPSSARTVLAMEKLGYYNLDECRKLLVQIAGLAFYADKEEKVNVQEFIENPFDPKGMVWHNKVMELGEEFVNK